MRLKPISILLVVLLLLASANPCAALVTDGGMPAPGQREPKALPAVVAVGGYVLTNTELIALLVGTVGSVVGYATITVDKHGVGDVLDHWNEFQETVSDFFHGTAGGHQLFHAHDTYFYKPNTPGFSLVEQRYNTAKAAKDSYEDSKRKGIPVPGNHGEVDGYHKMPDVGHSLSSKYLFNNPIDRANGCPKQIRYFNEKGERDMDIDFYHQLGKDSIVTFPHKHYWINGVRDESHIYEGIDEIIHNWKCKDYDFENSKWRR